MSQQNEKSLANSFGPLDQASAEIKLAAAQTVIWRANATKKNQSN